MSNKYDVIVIGAGIGGLTAAAILARNGKKVLVLEKNPVPGGYAVNFRRGEFEFDASLHLINKFERDDSSNNFLEICGINNKIRLIKPEYLYRSIFPDFDIQVPQCDLIKYTETLTKYFPKEKHGINELFEFMRSIFCRLEDFGERKIQPAKFNDYLNKTYQEILDEFLADMRLKAIISQLWVYYGAQISKISGIYFCYPWYDYTCRGGYYPAGGGQAIADALAEVIKENRGKIKFSSKVDKILIRNQMAYAIVDINGNEYFADKIISNINAYNTFHNLVGEKFLPFGFIDEIDRMESSISAFQVYLGLNVDLKTVGFHDYTIYVNTDYNLDKQYEFFLRNDFHNVPFGLTLCSNLEHDYSPKGKSVMTILTFSDYDFWTNFTQEKYKEIKNNFASILIKRAEKVISNLSSYIEKIEISTPLTMERYTGNYKGAIYGWSQIIAQSGARRLKQKTPIKNLYLSGAWTRPGGGIKGVMSSGIRVSNKILEESYDE